NEDLPNHELARLVEQHGFPDELIAEPEQWRHAMAWTDTQRTLRLEIRQQGPASYDEPGELSVTLRRSRFSWPPLDTARVGSLDATFPDPALAGFEVGRPLPFPVDRAEARGFRVLGVTSSGRRTPSVLRLERSVGARNYFVEV